MIDIHNHILPFMDDGANDWEQALQMAQRAVDDGIRSVIATPHHANGKYMNEAAEVRARIAVLKDRLDTNGIDLEVLEGQEIRVYDRLLEDMDRGSLLTLGGSRYLLIELPSSSIPRNAEELIYELGIMGTIPIIAHPERCSPIAESPDRLRRLVEAGAFAQLTAQCVSGERGSKLQKISLEMIRTGLAHFVATDAHDTSRRPFVLSQSYACVEKEIGESAVSYLQKNAENLVNNKEIDTQIFNGLSKKNFFAKFFLGK